MVCQNQSIDESNAELARDLRILVRERLKAGDSDERSAPISCSATAISYLLKPPFKLETWRCGARPSSFFWLAAASYLLPGGGKRSRAPANPLSEAERAKLDAMLGEDGS